MTTIATISTSEVRFVKELYPRLKPHDDVVERYRDALDNLPPIVVARDSVLVDGYHRWQAHVREGATEIRAENLGNLTDAEIIRESIKRNATHGQQLTRSDKQRMAGYMWSVLADFSPADRVKEIAELFAVSERSVQGWTKDARKAEREDQQAKAWDMWLDCKPQTEIAEAIGVDQKTISNWLGETANSRNFLDPPASRQHFDVWQFAVPDWEVGGQRSYFGVLAPEIMENLLWFFTDPGDVVVDLFAGSGTAIDVAKRMGRRIWAADIRGNHYSPHLPIHRHDATQGWPESAPRKAKLVFLDPPYWQQAAGRYSSEPGELAEMDLEAFYAAWWQVAKAAMEHAERVAFIISPTQREDGSVIDHATDMIRAFAAEAWEVERRIIVPYSTQQATGQQVTWARENKRMLKLYRDLVVLSE